jgi:hypothetical protein
MPFPPHYRLEWGGDFASDPLEIWSNGVNMTHQPGIDGAEFPGDSSGGSQAIVDYYSAKVVSHFQHADSGYGTNARLKWVKMNVIGPDGRRVNQLTTWRKDQAGNGALAPSQSQGPITNSLVVTFLTDAARGRASRGRVFIPHPAVTVSAATAYRVSTADQTRFANQWSAFLTSLADAEGIDQPNALVAVVISELETPGLRRTITRAQVGNFIDYMGSRRNRLREVRVNGAAVTTTGV